MAPASASRSPRPHTGHRPGTSSAGSGGGGGGAVSGRGALPAPSSVLYHQSAEFGIIDSLSNVHTDRLPRNCRKKLPVSRENVSTLARVDIKLRASALRPPDSRNEGNCVDELIFRFAGQVLVTIYIVLYIDTAIVDTRYGPLTVCRLVCLARDLSGLTETK